MVKIIIIVLVYIIIGLIEITPIYKKKKKKEMILYLSVLSISLILNIMLISGVKFVSLAEVIDNLMRFE